MIQSMMIIMMMMSNPCIGGLVLLPGSVIKSGAGTLSSEQKLKTSRISIRETHVSHNLGQISSQQSSPEFWIKDEKTGLKFVSELKLSKVRQKTYDRRKVRGKRKRGRRYAYEDTHEWPDDDSMDYDFDEDGETEELTIWQEIGRNWQAVFLRFIFLLSGGFILLMIICCCCKVCCKMCCYSIKRNCVPCGPFLDIIASFYEDPMYKKAKNLAEMMGLKLDYQTYLKIRAKFEQEGTGSYNPLGLPYME